MLKFRTNCIICQHIFSTIFQNMTLLAIQSLKQKYLVYILAAFLLSLNLKMGKHKIEIKVYDTYNNLAKESVLFVVTNDLKFNIYNLMNYPNPFSKSTSFIFEHDREDEDLEISIQIINLYGEVLYKHHEIIESSRKKIEAINWNGRGFNNQILSEGIYIYKLIVKSLFDGAYNTSYKKLIKRN